MTKESVISPISLPKPSFEPKLDYIDSLRGIAILMVIFVHTSQSVPELPLWIKTIAMYGQFGVQLFFVVSAITLCISTERRYSEKNMTKKYFVRRFFRIAPLYYIGILWYFFFMSAKMSLETGVLKNADGYTLVSILANFFFVHGFYPPANNNIVPGGWSIGTEMAFYILFPALFLLFKKINNTGTIQLIGLFTSMICGYYFFEYYFVATADISISENNFYYYNLFNQLPVFMLGILMYFLSINRVIEKIPTVISLFFLCLFLGLTVILWHGYLFNIYYIPPKPFILIPFTVGMAFVFLYNIFMKNKALNLSILKKVGRVSYSMYLLHFMFAWHTADYLNRWLGYTERPIYVFALYYILTVVASFALGIISERFIEKPGILFGKRLIEKMDSVSL